MRLWLYFVKALRENLRDWKILILVLIFAPLFVYMMKGYFSASTPAYGILVVNHDEAAAGAEPSAARGLIDALKSQRHPDGSPVFAVTEIADARAGRARIEARDADLLVEIPQEFSRRIRDYREGRSTMPARLIDHAAPANVRSSMAAAYSDFVAYTWAVGATGARLPLDVGFQPVGSSRTLTDLELYVPALLVLALIMVFFSAAATLIREVDKGTLVRLTLSPLRTSELLGALTLAQTIIGVAALALAYLAAVSIGYRTAGSLVALFVVAAVSTPGIVALAVLTTAFLKSTFELLTVGTLPFFLLMFFSDCMFPLPKLTVFHLAGHAVTLNNLLPTSLTVQAFQRILNFGGGLGDVAFELGAIVLLSAVYFVLGAWLFRRRHQGRR